MKVDKIDFLKYKDFIKVKRFDGVNKIYCLIRKKWLVLQPEEWVRQLFLLFLTEEMNYPKGSIAVEKEIKVLERKRRFDILVYNKQLEPFMIVELKAPKVQIDHTTLEQVSAYNLSFRSSYLVVTNGISSYVFKMDYENLTFLPTEEFPEFK